MRPETAKSFGNILGAKFQAIVQKSWKDTFIWEMKWLLYYTLRYSAAIQESCH